jgi:hypothetical protein
LKSSSGKSTASYVSASSRQPEVWSAPHFGHASAVRGTSSPQTGHIFGVLSLLVIAVYWLPSGHNANIHLLSEKEISHGRVSWQTLNLYRNGPLASPIG